MTPELQRRIDAQTAEFTALTTLAERWASLRQVAGVDDDYPAVRHRYEGAMQEFLKAVIANRPYDIARLLPCAAPTPGPFTKPSPGFADDIAIETEERA